MGRDNPSQPSPSGLAGSKSGERRMRIVILSTNDEARRRVLHLLQSDGISSQLYEFVESASMDDFRSIFASMHPDLVLVPLGDSKVPRRELCRYIRVSEGRRHTGIIIMSESTIMGDSLVVECLEMGADDFVTANCTPEELRARVRAVLRVKRMTDEMRKLNHRLQVLSMTDELTGLCNMRAFSHRADALLQQCRGGSAGLGIIMMDLDHFKRVNDTSNHLMGSHVLAETGKMLHPGAGLLDPTDIGARYGGDEFILAAPSPSVDAIKQKAEAIRNAISNRTFEHAQHTYRVTASLGVAWTAPGFAGHLEDLIKAADFMLYHSKEMGRNRVSALTMDEVTRRPA